MTKQSAQIAVHLSPEYQQAVQNLAHIDDVSVSEWVRNLIERELICIHRQAQNTLQAVACLENHQNHQNGANS